MNTIMHHKSWLAVIILMISLLFGSCYREEEIVKELKAPDWIRAEVGQAGRVTLNWAPVPGAVKYAVCWVYTRNSYLGHWEYEEYNQYNITYVESPTFTHVNKDWQDCRIGQSGSYYAHYAVCMIDENGNHGAYAECDGIRWK